MLFQKMPKPWRWFFAAALAGLLFLLAACGGQPLQPWHTARLSEEFKAGKADDIRTFEDYLALEDRLFDELRDKVYAEVATGPEFSLVRYSEGSAADPGTRDPDWNRTFELPSDSPRGGLLLLHGMSDSPYSLRQLGKTLNEKGFWVIGLRLPGHGTAPSGLRSARWQDMAAAVRIGMQRLVDKVGDKPIHVAGYSTGAPLALDHALNALDDDNLRQPDSLILISPAIGITAAAALAGPKAGVGRVPGLGRFAYTQIVPEFDPFKYNSFTANAGSQVHKLTRSVGNRISNLTRARRGGAFPPIIVFKSTVDATVSTEAVISRLLGRLPDNGNELVLFDINRAAVMSILLVSDPGPFTERLMNDGSLPFAVRLVTNENSDSTALVSKFKPPLSPDVASIQALDHVWPRSVISLSHVALPFPPDDPLYGAARPDDPNVLFLGQAEIRGERGLMKISSDWLLRLRYNPFYSVLEHRVLEWVDSRN
jgi:alpha-beta hydrolase superfamily lysophospholipase